MILLDRIREEKLTELAHKHYSEELEPLEIEVIRESSRSDTLPGPEESGTVSPLRSQFIYWLASDLEAATLIAPDGIRVSNAKIEDRLSLRNCHVYHHMSFRRCEFTQGITLDRAETKSISLTACSLVKDISAEGARIDGSFCLKRVTQCGLVNLRAAQIDGDVIFLSTGLSAQDTSALSLEGARVTGAVHLYTVQSSGEVRLRGAEVRGPVALRNANLSKEGVSLNLDGAILGDSIFLDDGFEASGLIRMVGTHIRQSMEFRSAKLKSRRDAVWLINSQIGGTAIFAGELECLGAICILGSRIEGDVRFLGATLSSVSCLNSNIRGDWAWQGIKKPEKTWLRLTGTEVKALRDDRNSWPSEGQISLDGLVYEALLAHDPPSQEAIANGHYGEERPLDPRERIEWLMRQPNDKQMIPQPWHQLARTFEAGGDRKSAKHVLYCFHCMRANGSGRRQSNPASSKLRARAYEAIALLKPARWLGRAFAKLEEAPARILCPIALSVFLGWITFGIAGAQGALAPTDPAAYRAFTTGQQMPEAYPTLNPFIYALENTLPLVKLGQDEKWAPDRNHRSESFLTNYWFLTWTRWFIIVFGWFQATILAAALANRFKP